MPKRLGPSLFGLTKDDLRQLCENKGLNDYETEIIYRIYFQRQSIHFIADTLDFTEYGKNQGYYSARSINQFHKDAFIKIIK